MPRISERQKAIKALCQDIASNLFPSTQDDLPPLPPLSPLPRLHNRGDDNDMSTDESSIGSSCAGSVTSVGSEEEDGIDHNEDSLERARRLQQSVSHLGWVLRRRYLSRGRYKEDSSVRMQAWFLELSETDFKQEFRLNRESFEILKEQIQRHPVYEPANEGIRG